MILYPTIEIQGGHSVSLTRGRIEEPHHWGVDPVELACQHARAGAEWLHVTDLDAAAGTGSNAGVIVEIIRKAGAPVQVGGGIRGLEAAERWIEAGAGRVVLATLAATQPNLVKQAAKYHPDQVVLAVDVFRGKVLSHAWREETAMTPEGFIALFAEDPLAAVMVTDIDADVGEAENALALVTGLAAKTRHPVIASGMVRSIDDLARLRYVPGVAGAIVGRALMDGRVILSEALELCAAHPGEAVADFV